MGSERYNFGFGRKTDAKNLERKIKGKEGVVSTSVQQKKSGENLGYFLSVVVSKVTDELKKILASENLSFGKMNRVKASRNTKIARELVRVARELISSVMRHCSMVLAKDGQWYMFLADEEHGDYNDSTAYGPFGTMDDADDYLRDNFSNPGGFNLDKSGKKRPPKRSPNGRPVVNPKRDSRGPVWQRPGFFSRY